MSKRRIDEEESDIDISSSEDESENELIDEEPEDINIDFDFFDIDKEVDFHAIKNLLRQLIGEDSKQISLSNLTESVLETLTTTIKTDGKESDPYAFLSPLNYKDIKTGDYIKYLHKLDSGLSSFINKISNKKISLLISERLINMPIQVIPAMYKIVLEDLEKSGESFDYFIIPSRKYEVNEDTNNNKKAKTIEIDYYHHEDQFFEQNSSFKFETSARKGIIQTFIIVSHDGLLKSISELEEAIALV